MGPTGCHETSVYTILHRVNTPKGRKSHYQTPVSSHECEQNATLRVTTAVLLKIRVFYDVTACRLVNGFRGNKQLKNAFKKGSYVLRNVRNHSTTGRHSLKTWILRDVQRDGRMAQQLDSTTWMVNPKRQVQNSQRVTKAQTKPVSNLNLPRNQP
jgi:hypothetical protein